MRESGGLSLSTRRQKGSEEILSILASLEAIWTSWLIGLDEASWQVVVCGIGTEICEFDMVVVCQGSVVGD